MEERVIKGLFGFWSFPILNALLNAIIGRLSDCSDLRTQMQEDNVQYREMRKQSQVLEEKKVAPLESVPTEILKSEPEPVSTRIVPSTLPTKISKEVKHVPYYSDTTLTGYETKMEYIQRDKMEGLGEPGRTGYIYNRGAGDLEFRLFDGEYWTKWMILTVAEYVRFVNEDNLLIEMIKLRAKTEKSTRYILSIASGGVSE